MADDFAHWQPLSSSSPRPKALPRGYR